MKGIIALVLSIVIVYVCQPLIASLPFTVTPSGIVIKLAAVAVLWIVIRGILGTKSK